MIDIRLAGTLVRRNAVLVFGSGEGRRIIAQHLVLGQFFEIIECVLAEIDLEVVANGMQDLEQGEKLVMSEGYAAVEELARKLRPPPVVHGVPESGFLGVI